MKSKLVKLLDIKHRRYHLRRYKSCFVCSDVIDVMITQELVKTRAEGVLLGQALQKQLNLWHHVVDGHHLFNDKYLFFRLTNPRNDDYYETGLNDSCNGNGGDKKKKKYGYASSSNSDDIDIYYSEDGDEDDDRRTVSSISMSQYDFGGTGGNGKCSSYDNNCSIASFTTNTNCVY